MDVVALLHVWLLTGITTHDPIFFRQLGMNIENSEIMDNLQAGIHHDPKLEKLEQRELAEWMSLIDEGTPNTIVRIPKSEAGTDPKNPLVILEGESKLIISQVGNFSLESFIFTTPSHQH